MRMFYNKDGGFQSIGYTPEGRILTVDTRARLASWDVAGGRPDRLFSLDTFHYRRVAFLKATSSGDGSVGLLGQSEFQRFDLTTRKELPLFSPREGHTIEVSDDGTLAVVKERGVPLWRVWDLRTYKPTPEHFRLGNTSLPLYQYSRTLSHDNRYFAISTWVDGSVLLWNRDSVLPRTVACAGRGRHYQFLAFGPESRFLVGAQISRRGQVTVWDLPSQKPRWSMPQEVFIWAIAVHPSGNLLAVATNAGRDERTVRFLDAETGIELRQFNWRASDVRCLAFSPDGLTCAAGCSDRRLVVWDVDE